MTKGKREMAVAMIYPETEKRGRGNKRSASGQFSGVPTQRVSEARAVLAYSREIAEARSGLATARSRLRWHSGVTRPEIATCEPLADLAAGPRGRRKRRAPVSIYLAKVA